MRNYLKIEEDAHKLEIFDKLAKIGITIGTITIGEPAAAILGDSLATIVKKVLKRNTSLFHNEKQLGCRNQLIGAMVEKSGHYENTHRSSSTTEKEAEEIFEDLYLKCEKESEEQKIKYMGNLAVNFHQNSEGYPVPLVHQFIKDLEEFTYNQLCFLSVIHRHGIPTDPLMLPYRRPIYVEGNNDLQHNLYWLKQKGYINDQDRTTSIGKEFINLTHLYEIPFEDCNPIAETIGLKPYGHDTCEISKKPYAIWTHKYGGSSDEKLREPKPTDEWVAAYWVFSSTGYTYHQVSNPNESFQLEEAKVKLLPQISVDEDNPKNVICKIQSKGIEITIPSYFPQGLCNKKEFNSQNEWDYKGSLYANVRTSQELGCYTLLYPKGIYNPKSVGDQEDFTELLIDCFISGAKIF